MFLLFTYRNRGIPGNQQQSISEKPSTITPVRSENYTIPLMPPYRQMKVQEEVWNTPELPISACRPEAKALNASSCMRWDTTGFTAVLVSTSDVTHGLMKG